MKYLVLLLLLVACGPGEKKEVDFGKNGGGQSGLCEVPSFFRENEPPIADPAALPRGNFRLISTEVFFREEEGSDLRAHFMEGQRGSEFVSRKICTSALPARALFSIPFAGLSEFSVGDEVAFRRFTASIFGEKEAFSFSRTAPGGLEVGKLSAVLGQWSNWIFYKLSGSEYELRMYVYETLDERRVTKLMVLRFNYSPSSSPATP